jgi:hypothetical protein
MPSIVIEILHWPLFPIVAIVLIGLLYWRGFLAYRNPAKKNAARDTGAEAGTPGDKPKTP